MGWIEKAAAKWKELQRAGQLASADLARITEAGLYDPAREIAGLAKGNEAIRARLGVKKIVTDPDIFKQKMRDLAATARQTVRSGGIRDFGRSVYETAEHIPGLLTPHIGGAYIGPLKRVYIHPTLATAGKLPEHAGATASLFATPAGKIPAGVPEMIERHELDEARGAARNARKLTGWKKYLGLSKAVKDPVSRRQALRDVYQHLVEQQRRVVAARKLGIPYMSSPKDIEQAQRLGERVAAGGTPYHSHIDPSVIARESENLALMPEDVRRVFKSVRRYGEAAELGRHGGEYGYRIPGRVIRSMGYKVQK